MEKEMMKWLVGGPTENLRSMEFLEGPNGVRCILKVSRGSTAQGSTTPFEVRSAEGTGLTMGGAFEKAYEDLVTWLA